MLRRKLSRKELNAHWGDRVLDHMRLLCFSKEVATRDGSVKEKFKIIPVLFNKDWSKCKDLSTGKIYSTKATGTEKADLVCWNRWDVHGNEYQIYQDYSELQKDYNIQGGKHHQELDFELVAPSIIARGFESNAPSRIRFILTSYKEYEPSFNGLIKLAKRVESYCNGHPTYEKLTLVDRNVTSSKEDTLCF